MKELLCIYLFVLPFVVLSQNESFEIILETSNDSETIDDLIEASHWQCNRDPAKAENLARKALLASIEINYNKGIANSHLALGRSYFNRNIYVDALKNLVSALEKFQKLNDKNGIAETYIVMLRIYLEQNYFPKILEYANKALPLFKEAKNEIGIAHSYASIAIYYAIADNINIDSSLSYYKKALPIYKKHNYISGLARCYYNLGKIYEEEENYDTALHFFNEGLILSKQNNDNYYKSIGFLFHAEFYANPKVNQQEQAEVYADSARTIAQEIKLLKVLRSSANVLGNIWTARRNYEKAYQYLKEQEQVNKQLYNQAVQLMMYDANLNEKEIINLENAWSKSLLVRNIIAFTLLFFIAITTYSVRQRIKLTKLNFFKNKLLAIISHDLKGPLNSLKGSLQLYSSASLSVHESQLLMAQISEDMEHSTSLINNLLSWASLQFKKDTYRYVEFNLYVVAKDMCALYASQAEKKQIKLTNEVSGQVNVFADSDMINVVMRNLISNAIKFTKPGGEVKIAAEAKKKIVKVTISDSGIGMDEEKVKTIFKGNLSLSTRGTANERGTGLGLMLCKEFVEKNGGKISIKSELDIGTSISFTLPKASDG